MKVPRPIKRRLSVPIKSLLHLQYLNNQPNISTLSLSVLPHENIEELHGLASEQTAEVHGRGKIEPHLNIYRREGRI